MIIDRVPSTLLLESKNLGRLFIASSVRETSIALLGLFSPIFILQSAINQNYTFNQALLCVLLFYAIVFATKLFSLVYVENLSQRTGFQRLIQLSIIPFLLFLPLLMLVEQNVLFGVPAAILWGVTSAMYWWGYHGYFIRRSLKNRWGTEIGEFELLHTLPRVLTPIAGALIVSAFGFPTLFIISAILMVTVIFTIGHKDDHAAIADVQLPQALSLIVKHKSVSAAYFGQGADAMFHTVFWPVFIFILFGEVLTVGTVYSGAILFTALIALATGFWVDKRGVRQTVTVGSLVVAITWVARAIFSTVGAFVFIDSTSGVAKKLLGVSLDGLSYKKAAENDISLALLFREINLALGYLAAVGGTVVMFLVDPSLRGVLVLAGIFTLAPLFAVINKKI